MSTVTRSEAGWARRPERAARDAARSPWARRAARAGIAARGVVFLGLGYLLARIALGALGDGGTGTSVSGQGVASAIAAQSGGRVALGVLGVGLLLYALYSLFEAVRGPVGERSEAKRWALRGRSLWQAALYGTFGVYCLAKAMSATSGSGSSAHQNRQQEQWSARVLRWPAGWLWLLLLALVLFVLAGVQLRNCIKQSFLEDLERGRMSARAWTAARVLGVAGHAGRTGTFALVGWFVAQAAFEDDPNKGRGVDGSARMLASSSGGPVLLWLLAAGLVAFGLYLFVEARYRRV